VYPLFPSKKFIATIIPQLPSLTFGERCILITETLHQFLPPTYPEALAILIQALEPEATEDAIQGFDGFIIMPQTAFVSRYGLEERYYDISVQALYEMTKRFSAEMDIRFFIQSYPKRTLQFLKKLTQDPSPFARRLASEGTRPRLPLASRLPEFQKDPTPVFELLNKLKKDPNLMVRRSVANNLNDIAKDNPEHVLDLLEKWHSAKDKNTQWLIRHALRTLLKKGHPRALKLMGFDPQVQVKVDSISLSSKRVLLGDTLHFEVEMSSQEKHNDTSLMVDYILHFQKANGTLAAKVFKGCIKTLPPGDSFIYKGKHSLQMRSTRTLYPGKHLLEIQVNGISKGKKEFFLKKK
jgi:3-methyladenine DNA glycosylase AlkC